MWWWLFSVPELIESIKCCVLTPHCIPELIHSKTITCCCSPYMLLFIREKQVQPIHQSHHNHVRALLPAAPFPRVSPTLASESLSALNSLRVSSVSPALLTQGCDLSARRALNNREGRNKRNKQHQPSVFQQQREDTGITMPEPVPKGMQILSVKAEFTGSCLETCSSIANVIYACQI